MTESAASIVRRYSSGSGIVSETFEIGLNRPRAVTRIFPVLCAG